ncbi:ArsR/SmtB family transcription factor [Corynebacterium liangguodongii]|uniref:Uncharacterized protein n=1 Tax=Corynebacterium liangguodongii TaxID=2079535 RepID=A0A2S0WCI8_9CORY|nr:hypothetical protein C3E79_02385 [Corynebacterium liangguodongii]PWC00433.1 ArsR family transcriptional regulator [Corynebacterium liangguodongii]
MPLSIPINCYTRFSEHVGIIASVSNPVRWAVVRTLSVHGAQPQEKIAAYLQVSPSTLSRHLHILSNCHLIELRRVGKGNIVSLRPTAHRILDAALPIIPPRPAPASDRE